MFSKPLILTTESLLLVTVGYAKREVSFKLLKGKFMKDYPVVWKSSSHHPAADNSKQLRKK